MLLFQGVPSQLNTPSVETSDNRLKYDIKKTWLELLSLSICTISQSLLTPPLEHVFVADYYYCIMPESIKSSCSIQHFQTQADCAHVTSASLSQPNLNLAQAPTKLSLS